MLVEQAETVEVEEHDGVGLASPTGAGVERVEVREQLAPVGQARPLVGARLLEKSDVALLEALVLPHEGDGALAPRAQVDVARRLAAPALGDIHVRVRGAQRRLHVGAQHGDAHRHRRRDEDVVDLDRFGDSVADLAHQLDGLAHLHTRQHQHELVTADARHDSGVGCGLHEPVRYRTEHDVAELVAVCVVDLLEPVHVEEHHGTGAALRGEAVQALEEPLPVRQPGELVRGRLALGRDPKLLELRDVAECQDDAAKTRDRPQHPARHVDPSVDAGPGHGAGAKVDAALGLALHHRAQERAQPCRPLRRHQVRGRQLVHVGDPEQSQRVRVRVHGPALEVEDEQRTGHVAHQRGVELLGPGVHGQPLLLDDVSGRARH